MSVEICELLKDEHFLCKLGDAVASGYGFTCLLDFGYIRNAFQAAVVSVALPGSFFAMLLLMYLYRISDKNDTAEKILLIAYGLMNVLGAYVSWIRIGDYVGCPTTIYNPVIGMMCACTLSACGMLGEVFYNLKNEE